MKLRRDVFERRYGTSPAQVPLLSDFIGEHYLPWARANKASWKHDEFRSGPIVEHRGRRRLDEIAVIQVEKYKQDRLSSVTRRGAPRSLASVNRELELLSAIFTLAIRQKLVAENPCREVRRLDEANERDRYLSDEEGGRLLAALSSDRRLHILQLVTLELQTGMRKSELLNLRWNAVDFQRGLIHLLNRREHGTRTKNRKGRIVPMTSVARELLLGLRAQNLSNRSADEYVFTNPRTGRPYTDVKKGFRAACEEAGVRDFRFHDLRHTAATWLGEAGAGITYINAVLGHRSLQTSERYTHATDEGLRRAVEGPAKRVEGRDGRVIPHMPRFEKKAAG